MVNATERAVQLARNAVGLSSLNDEQLKTVVQRSGFRTIDQGALLYGVGDSRGRIYIVERGEIVIERPADEDRFTTVASFIDGKSFGELDILDKSPYGTRAVAERVSSVLIVPDGPEALMDVLDSRPDISAAVLQGLLRTVAGRIRSTNRLISERTPWVEKLREQVLMDKLTGLHNATYLSEEAGKNLSGTENGVLVVKPDNFKVINDSFGHDAGDRALRQFARVLKRHCGDGETAARIKSDIFALILPATGTEEARKRARKLLGSIKRMSLSDVAGPDFRLTASIGIAITPAKGELGEALERADTLMLAAREAGGDRVATDGYDE